MSTIAQDDLRVTGRVLGRGDPGFDEAVFAWNVAVRHQPDATDRARAWTSTGYEAISRAKRRYDPTNMMRFGHAVLLPQGEAAEQALPL